MVIGKALFAAVRVAEATDVTPAKTPEITAERTEIIARVREWAGSETEAEAWYRLQPIPALDGETPQALVETGRGSALRDYLDHLALGGYA